MKTWATMSADERKDAVATLRRCGMGPKAIGETLGASRDAVRNVIHGVDFEPTPEGKKRWAEMTFEEKVDVIASGIDRGLSGTDLARDLGVTKGTIHGFTNYVRSKAKRDGDATMAGRLDFSKAAENRPAEVPPSRPRPTKWADMTRPERIDAVAEGIAHGLTAAQIAAPMGCAPGCVLSLSIAVKKKALEVGDAPLAARISFAKADGAENRKLRAARIEARRELAASAAADPEPEPRAAPDAPAALEGVHLVDARPWHCRAPLWGPRTPTEAEMRFCGERTKPGSAYCERHLARFRSEWQPTKPPMPIYHGSQKAPRDKDEAAPLDAMANGAAA